MSRKHPRIWWSQNKPKVDWIEIVQKCQKAYPIFSNAEHFAFKQLMDIGLKDLEQRRTRKASGKAGHKDVKTNKTWSVSWKGEPDLCCDDPLYDGQPVF